MKKFLILSSLNSVTYKEIFPYIKNNELWLGVSLYGTKCSFLVPETYKGKNVFIEDGIRKAKVNNAIWFTNIPHYKRNQSLDLYKKYDPKDFPMYDNYCAFNVDKVDEIPCDEYIEIEIDNTDYDRWKAAYGDDVEIIKECENNKKKIRIHKPVYGVPITFLGKYCPTQFEIVAFRKGEDGKDLIFFWEEERRFNLTFESLFDSNPRNDKKCRRKSEWENYLCKNNDKNDIEPVDYFFPIEWQMSGNQRAKVNNKLMYARIFIKRK